MYNPRYFAIIPVDITNPLKGYKIVGSGLTESQARSEARNISYEDWKYLRVVSSEDIQGYNINQRPWEK